MHVRLSVDDEAAEATALSQMSRRLESASLVAVNAVSYKVTQNKQSGSGEHHSDARGVYAADRLSSFGCECDLLPAG